LLNNKKPASLRVFYFMGSWCRVTFPAGTYHSSVLPWTPSPWGRAFWVEEGEDHRELAVKLRRMERFKTMMQQVGVWDD
jgi:hypothetical protein